MTAPTTPSNLAAFDVTRYQDPLTIQRVIHTRKDDRDRRAVEERAAGELLRRVSTSSVTATGSFRSTRARRRSSVKRASRTCSTCRAASTSSTSSGRPDALPAIAADAVTIGAGTLWCQFSVINEEGARIAEAGGVVRRHGSVPQGRARPLRRTDALARLQHPADHIRARRTAVARASRTAPLCDARRASLKSGRTRPECRY